MGERVQLCPSLVLGMMFFYFFFRMISLYEYVVSRLSASISAISSQHFHIVVSIHFDLTRMI